MNVYVVTAPLVVEPLEIVISVKFDIEVTLIPDPDSKEYWPYPLLSYTYALNESVVEVDLGFRMPVILKIKLPPV